MNKRRILGVSILGAASAAGFTGTVAAQSGEPSVAPTIDEVVVTASRREQSLQEVPAAVTAFSPEDYKFQGLKQVADVLDYTPGVTFNDMGSIGLGTIAARGVPQSLNTPVFGIYLDDTPISTNTNFAGVGLFFDGMLMDLERVEVIKGPQGTLYGATSVGGMLRYISKDPALDTFRGSASAEVADTASGELGSTYNGTASIPLIQDTLGVTLSGFRQEVGGYVDYVDATTGEVIDEDVDGGVNEGYSVDLLYRATDRLDLRVKYMKQEVDSDIDSVVRLRGDGSDKAQWGEYTTITKPGSQLRSYEVTSGSLNFDLGWAMLTATSSYVEFSAEQEDDNTASLAPLVDYYDDREPGTTTSVAGFFESGSEKYVHEIRLTSSVGDQMDWIAGIYYADEESFNNQQLVPTPDFDLLSAAFPSEYREYAAFGDVTWYFSEVFDVTAGVRVSDSETQLSFDTSGVLVGDASLTSETVKDTVDTYLLAARYQPRDNLSIYARAASGYRPAQSNIPIVDPSTGEDVAPAAIESDSIWSYELGAKGSSGAFQYDVALWMIDWDNFQSRQVVNGVGTGGNAKGGLGAHGVEGELTYRVGGNLSLTANATYTESTLNDDEPSFGGVEGEQYPNLPEWTASLRWNYNFPVTANWEGAFGGGLRYVGDTTSYFSASTTRAAVDIDSRLAADLNLNVTDHRYTVGMYVTNLFDERSVVGRNDDIIAGTGLDSTGVFERPRTIGVNVRVDI